MGTRLAGIDTNVMRTIHRLQQVTFDFSLVHEIGQFTTRTAFMCKFGHQVTFNQRWILALLVVGVMATGSIQIEFTNMWCVDLIVALSA